MNVEEEVEMKAKLLLFEVIFIELCMSSRLLVCCSYTAYT